MSSLQVRLATVADGGALADLRASWSAGSDVVATREFTDQFIRWFEIELVHRRFWIADRIDGDAAEPVGMVNLLVFDRMPDPGRPAGAWGYLGNMYVRTGERRTGVGAALLSELLAYADERDLVRVVLNPSEASRPLYGRHGFAPAGDGLLIRTSGRRGSVHLGTRPVS